MPVAPSITWLLVRTTPSSVRSMPVPAALPPPESVVLMFTTAGVTASATPDAPPVPLLETTADVPEDPEPPDSSSRVRPSPNAVRNTTTATTTATMVPAVGCDPRDRRQEVTGGASADTVGGIPNGPYAPGGGIGGGSGGSGGGGAPGASSGPPASVSISGVAAGGRGARAPCSPHDCRVPTHGPCPPDRDRRAATPRRRDLVPP